MGNAVVKPLSSSPRHASSPRPDCPCPCPPPEADCPTPTPEPLDLTNPCYLWHHGHQGIDAVVLYDTVAAAYAAAHVQVALIAPTPHYWHKTETDVMSDIDANASTHSHVFPMQSDPSTRIWAVYQTPDLQVYLGLGFDLPANMHAYCPEGYYITDSNITDPEMPPLFSGPINDTSLATPPFVVA